MNIALLESKDYGKDITGLLNNDTFTILCRMWKDATKDSLQCFIRSHKVAHKRRLKWMIERFSSVESVECELKFSKEDPLPIRLALHRDCTDEIMQIEITQVEPHRYQHVVCEISLLDAEGNVAAFKKDEHFFHIYDVNAWSFPNFIPIKWLFGKKNVYLPNDTLSLHFEFEIYCHSSEINEICFAEYFDTKSVSLTSKNGAGIPGLKLTTSNSLESRVWDAYKDGKGTFCDVTVQTDKSSFPADKAIEYSDTKLVSLVDKNGSGTPGLTSTVYSSLSRGLLGLYRDGKFCDVTLKTDNSSFPVHKAVICAQSSVFTAMFETNLIEKQTGVVQIPNLSDDTVRQMLMFLYTDTVEDLRWESASTSPRMSTTSFS